MVSITEENIVEKGREQLEKWGEQISKKQTQKRPLSKYKYLTPEEKRKLNKKGCYLVYLGEDSKTPIYIGSNSSEGKTVRNRIYQIQRCGSHPLPYRMISEHLKRGIFGKLTEKEKKSDRYKKWFKKECIPKLYYSVIEERKNPLLLEAGLIFLFKSKYNNESKDFGKMKD